MPKRPTKPTPPYTSAEVATMLELSAPSIRRLAKSLQVGTRKGHDWFFTDADVATLRTRPGWGGSRRKVATP
jgi:hypothetical protein